MKNKSLLLVIVLVMIGCAKKETIYEISRIT